MKAILADAVYPPCRRNDAVESYAELSAGGRFCSKPAARVDVNRTWRFAASDASIRRTQRLCGSPREGRSASQSRCSNASPKIGFTPFADLRESVPLHKECAGLRPSRRGKARLWDTTPSSVIPLLPAPGCCASWRPGSPCRLHGPDADAGATLVVGSHEIARNRVTATSAGRNRRSKSTNPRQTQGTRR
jgi:hypothetical protein